MLLSLYLSSQVFGSRSARYEGIHIDHFSNLATNLGPKHLPQPERRKCASPGEQIQEVVQVLGKKPVSSLVVLIDSAGVLSVAVANNSAAKLLEVEGGEPVVLFFRQTENSH